MSILYLKPFYEPDPKTCNDLHKDSLTLMAMNMTSHHAKATGRLMTLREIEELSQFFYSRLMLENKRKPDETV